MTLEDALTTADEVELDLVEIVPTAEPPVCRIMDYGKFVFEQTKKKHASKKKQKQIQVKEIKIRPGTSKSVLFMVPARVRIHRSSEVTELIF